MKSEEIQNANEGLETEKTDPTKDAGAASETNQKKDSSSSAKPAAETKCQAELEGIKAEKDALQQKYDEQNDRYLRALAEYENFRKRTQREKDAIYGDATADAVTRLLPILDSFERASVYPCADEGYQKGIEMISKSIEEAFASLGVEEIPAENQHFDPNLHNAVLHVEDPTVGENTIVEVLRKGYRLGEKVIRFTMVKVAN